MANKLYNDTSIKAIADAIREKNGKTDTYTVAEMSVAINDISAGGGIEPIEETYNIVNSQAQAYLDWVEQNPYSASDYTTSYFDDHEFTVNDDPVGIDLTLPAGNLIVTDEGSNHSYSEVITAGKKTIYNLIPYKTKFIVENNDDIVSAGILTPTGSRRFIKGSGVNNWDLNMRDLGGLTCDGGAIKYGKIIRGGAIYAGDTETLRILHDEVGIRAELDLLGGHLGNTTSPIGGDVDFCCPTSDGTAWLYYDISKKASMRQAFRFIFDSVKRGRMLYYHCQQGADRTGTLSVLIEGLLGVPQNQVDVDYELTSFSSDGNGLRKRNGTAYKSFMTQTINNLPGSTFRDKIVNYIASLGFTADEINDFRAAMSTGTPETVTPSIATYTVTNTLTNASSNNTAVNATEYQPYNATITADNGYVINNVLVKMGGVDVTGNVWTGVETNLRHKVTVNLTHCTSNNTTTAVIDGQGYAATLTTADGYTLDGATISITMGGVDMSAYYTNGVIAIPSVTGDIEITATAVQSAPAYTNLADPSSEDWMNGYKISGAGAIIGASGKTLCNKIDCNTNDVIRVKGVTFKSSNDRYLMENTSGAAAAYAYISSLPNVSLSYTMEGDVYVFTILQKAFSGQGNIRFSFDTPTDANAVVITKNEPIEGGTGT